MVITLVSSFGALMACVYVAFYNFSSGLIEDERMRHGGGMFFSLTEYFVNLQWYAFLIPFAGLLLGLRFYKLQNELGVFLVSVFLVVFALAWVFLAIFVWQNQSIPHWD
jgi:4-amino-4-deoxy-L-arabinose transferase-like glycosyltransferase